MLNFSSIFVFIIAFFSCKSVYTDSALKHHAGDLGVLPDKFICKQDPKQPKIFVDYTRHLISRLVTSNKKILPEGSAQIIDKICIKLDPTLDYNAQVDNFGHLEVGRNLFLSGMTENMYAALIAHEIMHYFVNISIFTLPAEVSLSRNEKVVSDQIRNLRQYLLGLVSLAKESEFDFQELLVWQYAFEILTLRDEAKKSIDDILRSIESDDKAVCIHRGPSNNPLLVAIKLAKICNSIWETRANILKRIDSKILEDFKAKEKIFINQLKSLSYNYSIYAKFVQKVQDENLRHIGWYEILVNDASLEMLIRAQFPPESVLEFERFLKDHLSKPQGSKRTLPFCEKNAGDGAHQNFCWNLINFEHELIVHRDYYHSLMRQPKVPFPKNPIEFEKMVTAIKDDVY